MSKSEQGRKSKFERELDYNYVSKESLFRLAGVFLLLAAAVVGAVYYFTHRVDGLSQRAAREIARAEALMTEARLRPDAASVKEELDVAGNKLAAARSAYEAGKMPEAVNAAVEAQSIAQRVKGGPTLGDALIVDSGGKVEVQRANRATWETAKNGMKLFEGDFLKTGATGTAELMAADGTFFRVKPESLFEVYRTKGGTATGPKQSRLKLITGIINTNTPEGGRSTITTDTAEAVIDSKSNVGVDVDQQKTTGTSVFKGGATVTNVRGQSVQLVENERVIAQPGGGGFSQKIRLPDTPSPVRPDDNAVFDLQKKQPIPLGWSPVKQALRYHIQIARSRLFIPDSLVVDLDDRVTTETVVSVNEEGSFFWRVAALGKGNLASDWSPYRRFRAVPSAAKGIAKTTPPDLVVDRPQVISNIVTITGRAEPGATVTVNGEPADPDSTGAFKKIISITREGFNTVIVKAVDGSGNETVRPVKVLIQTN